MAKEETVEEQPEQEAPEAEEPKVLNRHERAAERENADERSVEEMVDEAKEIGARAKQAGFTPFKRVARAYLSSALDTANGILNAIEGKKKKGD